MSDDWDDVFDRDAAEHGREEGMSNAESGAGSGWMTRAIHAGRLTAADKYEFIVDDVWKHMDPVDVPPDSRAMGPVMTALRAAGVIEWSGGYQLSDRRTAHRNPRRIWRSRVYGKGLAQEPLPW